MNIYETATGDCATCGKDANGSLYWTPLPDEVWRAVRPLLAPLFQDEDHVQNVLFIPDYSKPFCSPKCSLDWYQEHGGFNAS